MKCQDVDVTSCSQMPLCPCMQEWDQEVFVQEQRVLLQDRLEMVWSIGFAVGQLAASAVKVAIDKVGSIAADLHPRIRNVE